VPPWAVDFRARSTEMPAEVDFAVVGGGFTGLAAAAWLRNFEPQRSVAVFEAESVGSGASGRTGGLVLAETSGGDLPGLGDVLAGFTEKLGAFEIDCDLVLPGAWEIGRKNSLKDSAISWQDSGELRVVHEIPGGTIDAGKLLTGLARAADRHGAMIFEDARVESIEFDDPMRLRVSGKEIRARHVLLATNAQSLELNTLASRAEPMMTLAVATEPLSAAQLEEIGLASRKPFYTTDLPYLWGRTLPSSGVIFGGGRLIAKNWREMRSFDIATGEAAELIARIEKRVHGLHPALRNVKFTHRWGGPILVAADWLPIFQRHPQSRRAIVLGAYAGHGVALSVYLGCWAAEALLGRRELPEWETV
jgi:glycine/D-amino acid oxidase-like deaminating enzyme